MRFARKATGTVNRTVITVTLLCAAVFAPNCTKNREQGRTSGGPFRIAVNSWIGWGPLYIAKEKKFFGDLDVDIMIIEDAGHRRAAMVSGTTDAYGSGVDGLALDASFGVSGKAVMCFDESIGADGIIAKSNVTWENMAGRRVAVQKGMPSHFLLLFLMSQHGLKPHDVQMIDMNANKIGGALVAGTADVGATWEPWLSEALSSSTTKKLFTTAEQPGLIIDILVVRDPILQTRSGDVEQILTGWFRAVDWYANNRDEGNRLIARSNSLRAEDVPQMVSGIRFSDTTRNRELMGSSKKPGPIYELFERASTLWKSAGMTNSSLSALRYFDAGYLERAYEDR